MAEARHVHLDAVGGIAGDMFVAAMLDALPALRERVLSDIAAVLPAEAGTASLDEGHSGGLRALRFGLTPAGDRHDHDHDHDHHDHAAGSFRDMCARIRSAALAAGTARHAVAILTVIAEAEARIHAVPVDEVHFHEIAGWDSLLDVVAAGSIAAALAGTSWSVSDLPRGGGLVRTQHGLLPVPAPATAEILTGFAWRDDGVGGERVTPTGAAILRHLVGDGAAMPRPGGRLLATGTGAGTRALPGMPNVLRALVMRPMSGIATEQVAVLSFEVDDMTGEEIGTAAERLRQAAGVLDLSTATRLGKKSRPLESFRLLVRPAALEEVKARCFAETSTIGLRWRIEERAVLPREAATALVEGETVRVKGVVRPDGERTRKAESDDLRHASLAERRRLKAAAEAGGAA